MLNEGRRKDASTHIADTVELAFVNEAFLVEVEAWREFDSTKSVVAAR
jgi:hypothetical protein